MTAAERLIYLDNHATTRVDPRVVAAMEPYWTEQYGNAGSTSHQWGTAAREAVEAARAVIAGAIGADAGELIFTSGATESNNLAIRGLADRQAASARRNHLISVATEHRAVLDPLQRLERRNFHVTYLPVHSADEGSAWGRVPIDALQDTLCPETLLVSVMLANNETGVIQPLREIAAACRAAGDVLLHCDATQALGKLPVDVRNLDVDLLSFSAHKIYGPKGVGALFVRRRTPPIRLQPLIDGGGQERGLRSGTLPVPLIVGFARAVELAVHEMAAESARVDQLRQHLWNGLQTAVPNCRLNGPAHENDASGQPLRLINNLNIQFAGVEGASLMLHTPQLAMSSGSACTSAHPTPSHVLRAMGLDDDQVRSSVRIGLGRFNTADEIQLAVTLIAATVKRLRAMV